MEIAMWNKMKPIMHGLATAADTWERFGNALSPTPPFPENTYRLRLAALFIPALAGSMFVNSYMIMKNIGFGVGFGFFGDPIISRGIDLLNRKFPNWQKLLELRNTILKGVPTNAQLTITLLRVGEANNAPIPPPPHSELAPQQRPVKVSDQKLENTAAGLNVSQTELKAAAAYDPQATAAVHHKDVEASKSHKHGSTGSKILNFFRGTTAATVKTAITVDSIKAKAGSEAAKNRLGVVPHKKPDTMSGPIEFQCRYDGHKGYAYITNKATVPCIAFSSSKTIEKIGTRDREDLHPAWSIAIADIKELKKVGGYGWKAKLVVGWALDRYVKDGITIIDRQGQSWTITAMPLRDELFNRLASIGGQKWSSW